MKPLSRRTYAIFAIVFAAVIFVGLNMGADTTFTTARLDLTQNRQYTLAQGTKNILRNLREPILLKFFYSKKTATDYAQVNAYATRVRDLLNEYAALSGGKLVVEEIDPEPFTAAEDEATSYGLSGAPTQTGDVVYFGLVGTNTIDGRESIPFFTQDREPFLEYDLTSLVYHLAHPKKPKIGIISSIPLQAGAGGIQAMLQGRSRPYIAYQQLAQSYDTQTLERNITSIPSDIDVLMIVHPQALSDQQQYAIDQFVLKGGRALVFVDPASEISNVRGGFGPQQGPTSSDLPKLFKAWGIAYDPGKVVGDRDLAQPVQSSDPRNPVQPYPIWLHLAGSNFAHGDQVTGQLQSLNLASVGALAPIKGASTTFAPLVTSSDDAGLVDAMMVRFNPDPQSLMTQIVPTGHPFTIAARISGIAKTAFPKGPPAPAKQPNTPPGQKTQPPAKQARQVKVAKGPINVIVMADTDIFDDKFWVHLGNLYGRAVAAPFADNGAFILNAVENLTGSGDLISLRTRATNDRPFTVVKKLQEQAQAKFQQQQQALQKKLADTQDRLRTLQQGGEPGSQNAAAGLSPAQVREIDRFRHELTETRAKIREVQRNLRASVDELGSALSFANIAAVPLLVALFAIVLAIFRRRRRARAIAF